VRGVRGLLPEDFARVDDPDGRFSLFHDPYLNRGCMRAEEKAAADVQGVPIIPSRMMGRKIERLEVVVIRLDLRALLDRKAHTQEDILNLLLKDQHRVRRTPILPPSWERQVCFFYNLLRLCNLDFSLLEPFLDIVLQDIKIPADLGSIFRAYRLQSLEKKGKKAAAATQIPIANFLKRPLVFGAEHILIEASLVFFYFVPEIFHG